MGKFADVLKDMSIDTTLQELQWSTVADWDTNTTRSSSSEGENTPDTKLTQQKTPAQKFLAEHEALFSLGSGAEATVSLFQNKTDTGKVIAVKVVPYSRLGAKPGYRPAEIRILSALADMIGDCHRNIIKYYGWCADIAPSADMIHESGFDAIFLEYCNGGDLSSVKETHSRRKEALPETLIWDVFGQVAEGLAFLHEGYGTKYYKSGTWPLILHRDIKPGNIFLQYTANDGIVVKIGDFGTATMYPSHKRPRIVGEKFVGGTIDYLGPELPFASAKGDVWCLGASIHFLCTGEPPVDSTQLDYGLFYKQWMQARGNPPINESIEETIDEDWHMALPRKPLNVSWAPRVRGSNWRWKAHDDGVESCDWEGVYSTQLQRVLEEVFNMDWNLRIGAVELAGRIQKEVEALRREPWDTSLLQDVFRREVLGMGR